MKLQLLQDPPRLGGRERRVQRGRRVGVQVVHDDADERGVREVVVDQHLPLVGAVVFGAALGHRDLALC